jgi:hypothetical protein
MTTILGGFICCVVPLVCFGAGVYYARFGLPLSVHWRGLRGEEETIEE